MTVRGPRRIANSLVFRLVLPVLLLLAIVGAISYFFVLRPVAGFVRDHIEDHIRWTSRSVYDAIDKEYDEMLKAGLAGDPRSALVSEIQTLAFVEDFMGNKNLRGIVYREGGPVILMATDLPSSATAIIGETAAENVIGYLESGGAGYYTYHFRFEPWGWHIVFLKDAAEYRFLAARVTRAYAATGITLVLGALLLIVFFNLNVKVPISRIIAPLKAGASPAYRGISEFEFLSDSIRGMIEVLRESEEKYRSLAEESLVGVYIFQDGVFRYVNRKFCEIFGYAYDEVVGRLGPRDLTHPDDRAAVAEHVRRRLDGEAKSVAYEFRGLRKDGEILSLKVLGSASLYQGRPAITGTLLDLSRERVLEQQLRQSQKMDAVGRLAGGIAHDINNYLGAITGFCDLVKLKRPGDAELCGKMDAVVDTAFKASALIRQLLAFSRKQPVRPEVVNINEVVGRMETMMRRLLGEDLQLQERLVPDLWNVKADPSQLEQVVVNLLVNARDAMTSGGTVTIGTANAAFGDDDLGRHPVTVPGEYVMLAVSDTGGGIPDEIRDKIFEPFFTTKERGKGSGLGLSTVYGIVKQNAGYIRVDSAVDRGTTFRIFLPRCREGVGERPLAGDAPVPSGGGRGERILLVEDNEEIRASTVAVLAAIGYDVTAAGNGEEALARFGERGDGIDLVITDVVMPGMSGKEVMDRIRARKEGVPILFISGYPDSVITRHGVVTAGLHFLEKPFASADLGRKVREILH